MFNTPQLRQLQRIAALFCALFLSLTVASAADIYSEARRQADNAARLQKIYPTLRPKVAAVLSDLEHHGHRPLIDFQVHRTPAEQAALVRKGYSHTYYSYHNVTGPKSKQFPKGRPESLAADITDCRWFWNSPQPFWLKLARSAEMHDMNTGIYWGLPTVQRQRLRLAIATQEFDYRGPLGWDTAHIEARTVTLSQAKRGLRPK